MCGIVGVFPLNTQNLQVDANMRRALTLFLHNEVLFETIARGKDATGVAASFGLPYGSTEEDLKKKDSPIAKFWSVLKQPVDTYDFFLNDGTLERYSGQDPDANILRMMEVACLLERPLYHVLGHARAKTTGSEFSPLNNHPIMVGNIIGIHNGGVRNHKKIYEKHSDMTPQGEVDSEAIFQLLAEVGNDRALDINDIDFVTERIEGPHAILAYNRKYPEQVLYFHNKDRPMELAYIKELGLALICSEKKFLGHAMHVYNRARLTLNRNLPELSYSWRDIPDGEGGVIDISAEVEEGQDLQEMFPLFESADTLKDYENGYIVHGCNYGSRFKNKQTAGFKPSIGVSSATESTSSENKKNKTKIEEAELVDISGYSSDVNEGVGSVNSVTASAVMDDAGDEDGVPSSLTDIYDDDELRTRGTEYALGGEAKENKELLINRSEGNFRKLLASATVSENEAAEIVHQLYPEIFGEGFSVGFKQGVEDQEALEIDENENENESTVNYLKERITEADAKLHRAANIIANIRAFLMAAIITNKIGRVEEDESGKHLVFDENLEDFLHTAQGFNKTDPELVRGLFLEKDLAAISGGIVQYIRTAENKKTKKSAG